ncbi:MAG: lipocalin-like domain-containing protein [Vulcanimicrobiaceae bacterium]
MNGPLRPRGAGVAVALGALLLVALALLAFAAPFARPRPEASERAAYDPVQAGFAFARAPYRFAFPRDHFAHDAYATEWWYFTGHLRTASGRRFGYELTFFRFGIAPGDPKLRPGQSRWRGHELFAAHFAITDAQGPRFVYAERTAREALGMGGASQQRLAVWVFDWRLDGHALADPRLEQMYLQATYRATGGRDALALRLTAARPPAINGIDGLSRKGACASCASHYYSYTRLRTTGALVYDGRSFPVQGLTWMDHEFGSSELQSGQVGWDWFSIQLDDGRALMLYRLRERDGSVTPQSSGSLIERDGHVVHLPLAAFDVRATGTWTSARTGARYPSGWLVTVPAAHLRLTLVPVVRDQELAERGGISYWEGDVDVRAASGRPLGVGYVELTGYASPLSM